MWATKKLGENFETSTARKREQNVQPQKRLPHSKRWLFESRPRQGLRPRQTSVLHVPRERHIPSDKGLSHLPRVQKENDPKAKPTAKSSHSQRSQPHIPLTSSIVIIILNPTFVPTPQHSLGIPTQLSQIPFAILPAI
jgi:hypothetical protein